MSVQTWLMLAGAALVLFGALLRWRVSHYDLKDAAIGLSDDEDGRTKFINL